MSYDNWKTTEPEVQHFYIAILVNNQDQELEVEYDLLPSAVNKTAREMLARWPDYTVAIHEQINACKAGKLIWSWRN